jgi:hypothetical protein
MVEAATELDQYGHRILRMLAVSGTLIGIYTEKVGYAPAGCAESTELGLV